MAEARDEMVLVPVNRRAGLTRSDPFSSVGDDTGVFTNCGDEVGLSFMVAPR